MWRYFIELFTENCYGDFVEAAEVHNDGLPVCCDPTIAIDFDSTEELNKWVSKNTSLKLGEYGIKGIYYSDYLENGKH